MPPSRAACSMASLLVKFEGVMKSTPRLGIGVRVDVTHTPREHPAIEKHLDADDPQPVVALDVQWVAPDAADLRADFVDVADRVKMLRAVHPHGQLPAFAEKAVAFDLPEARVAVADAGDPTPRRG